MATQAKATCADASAAPVEIVIDGQRYRMAPMTDLNMGELDRKIQTDYIRMARQSLDPSMTPDEREREMSAARREASSMSFATHWQQRMGQVDYIAHVAWMSIRVHHPDIEYETVAKAMSSEETADSLADAIALLNKLDEPAKKKRPTKKRSKRKAAPRKSKSR